MFLVGALGVMLGVSPLESSTAQLAPRTSGAALRPTDGGSLALEAYYTRVGLEAAGRNTRANGIGGRVMWALDGSHAASSLLPSYVTRRAAIGVFGEYLPEDQLSARHLGVAADVTPLAHAIAGRVEPFLSLGAGALRTTARVRDLRADHIRPPLAPRPSTELALRTVSETSFMLMPSGGARVKVASGVAVQGDVRRLVTFSGAPRQHAAFGTGIRVTF
jgi:hypothetical protein